MNTKAMSDKSTQASDLADAYWNDTIARHQMKAGECPAKSNVMLVSSLRRLIPKTPAHAQRQDAQPAAPSAQADWYSCIPVEKRWTCDLETGGLCQDIDGPFVHRSDVNDALATQPAGAAVEAVGEILWHDGYKYARLFDDACPLPEGTKLYAQQRSGQDGVDDAMVLRACNAYDAAATDDGDNLEMGAQYPWMHAALEAALANPPAPAPGECNHHFEVDSDVPTWVCCQKCGISRKSP